MRALLLPVFVLSLLATPSLADPREDSVADVLACSAVRGTKARAKCYDAALPALRAAHPDAVALAQSRAEAMRIAVAENAKNEFGLRSRDDDDDSAPEAFGEASAAVISDEDGDIKSIDAVAVEVGKNLQGKIFVVLENGQIWRQIKGDSSSPYIPGDGAGLPVRISKGAFGSYFVKVGKARDAFKARRVK